MHSKTQQKKIQNEGRSLNFGDHSEEAERERVMKENGGRQTATPRKSDVAPESQRALQESSAFND